MNNGWKDIASGLSVGHKKIEKFAAVITTKLLVTVKTFDGVVYLKKVSVY